MPHHRADPHAAAAIAAAAVPLPPIDDPAASPFCGPFANATGVLADMLARHRVVLLGESTHGTSDFYHARAALTAHLVARLARCRGSRPPRARPPATASRIARRSLYTLPGLDVAQPGGGALYPLAAHAQ
jgi:hypothetical protein